MSLNSVINQIVSHRNYGKSHCKFYHVNEHIDLGNGEYFVYGFTVTTNIKTLNVSTSHYIRFPGGPKIHPTSSYGKINLSNIPLHVQLRYESYFKKGSLTQSLKHRSKKLNTLS
jgi:hypothetical protein